MPSPGRRERSSRTSPERPATISKSLCLSAASPILLTDTAGLRETDEVVERIGVDRARSLVEGADVLLWLGEPAEAPPHPRLVQVHPRADLPERGTPPPRSFAVSSLTGDGLKGLLERVAELASSVIPAEDAIALNRRQAAHLAEASCELECVPRSNDAVLIAEHFRAARDGFRSSHRSRRDGRCAGCTVRAILPRQVDVSRETPTLSSQTISEFSRIR